MIILKFIDKVFAEISIFLIKIYQYTISPDKWLPSLRLKWKICAHTPHCSEYSIKALKRYWFLFGSPKVIERVFSCVWSKEKIYDPEYYKVVFFSWAPIAVPFLHQLKKDKRFDIVWVVTMPDAPSGRWMEIKPNIIKKEAEKTKITDIQTPISLRIDSKKYAEDANNFKLRIEAKNPDYLVVIAYGKIIPQYILDIAKIAPINVHWSLLPKYRGASPLQSIFLNREKKSGITIMKMDADMDTGNMIDMLKFDIKFNWTVNNLIDEIMKKWPKFLNKTLANYAKRLLWEVKQENDKATYCQKITKEDWEINAYTDTLENIYSKYRAYFMRPKIFFHISLNKWEKAKRVIIENLELDEKKFEEYKNSPLIEWNKLNNAIINIALKPEWKKSMDRKSFKTWYIK